MQYRCGIDEAGRGCIAGSLFIAAVILPKQSIAQLQTFGIKDSKKLTMKQRKKLFEIITNYIDSHHGFHLVVSFQANMIDEYGLKSCMQQGLTKLLDFALQNQCEDITFDGNTNFGIQPIQTLIKGDSKDVLISAASILAKYHKDTEMQKLHALMPHYDFCHNQGYLTQKHTESLKKYGYSEFHRRSYHIKSFENSLFD